MSTVKTNRVQIGQSATATQNFTLTAEAADGTMKLARGVAGGTTQDIMTINSLGEVDFPQLVRLYGANGYHKLPGGLILQWGNRSTSALSTTYTSDVVTFPIAFPTAVLARLGSFGSGAGASWLSFTLESTGTPLTTMNIRAASGSALAAQPFFWAAIGY